MSTVTKKLDFGPHQSPPNWFLSFWTQIEDRLGQLESIVAENQRLRSALEIATKRIEELESQHSPPVSNVARPAGSEASKYALPEVPLPTPIETLTAKSAPTFASVAASSKNNGVAQKNRRRRPISRRQHETIVRRFTPMSDNQGYQYLYLPSRFRERISKTRATLRQLKLDNGRILDVSYPGKQVIALLVHNDYAQTALDLLATSGLKPIENFDPCDQSCLRDPAFEALTPEARGKKMTEIHNQRMLRTLKNIRDTIRPALARDFMNKKWISLEQYRDVLTPQKNGNKPPSDPNNKDPDTNDVDMTDDMPPSSPNASSHNLSSLTQSSSSSDTSFPSGAGEPANII